MLWISKITLQTRKSEFLIQQCNSAIARTGNCANNFEWVNPQFCGLLPQVTQKDDILKHKSLRSVNMYTYILILAWCPPPPTLTNAPLYHTLSTQKWVLLSISNISRPFILGLPFLIDALSDSYSLSLVIIVSVTPFKMHNRPPPLSAPFWAHRTLIGTTLFMYHIPLIPPSFIQTTYSLPMMTGARLA